MSSSIEKMEVAVVGGGLVGALEACMLAKRGFKVTLFESRHDGRNEPSYYGRSINLAISHRGISALERLNLQAIVSEQAIPMKARMIHDRHGRTGPIPYDPQGRCINSIERAHLNNFLLNKAESEYKVNMVFNHKLVDMDADKGELLFRKRSYRQQENDPAESNELFRYKFDIIFGCDGAKSSVRSLLSRQTEMEVSQTYIEHGYLELRIDPSESGDYKMPANYLHIWPRGEYMMIALPNLDKSFTCTLFMPFKVLTDLIKPGEGLKFFERNFPDSIELIGKKRIEETLTTVKASPLISIKCNPYIYKGKVILLGDAAHAMVPFYGQGMNCGFEDCLVLDEMLDKHLKAIKKCEACTSLFITDNLMKAFQDYNEARCPNGKAMCDLAMYNYIEMRDLVNNWTFKARKQVDNLLYALFPDEWIPLYTMVTFTRIPIHECVRRRKRQDSFLKLLNGFGVFSIIILVGLIILQL